MMIVALASCLGGEREVPCEGPVGGPAFDGFRWACAHAPPCSTEIDCTDPGWSTVDASILNAMTACLLGPCEARAPCVSDAVTVCSIDGDGVPRAARSLYSGVTVAR